MLRFMYVESNSETEKVDARPTVLSTSKCRFRPYGGGGGDSLALLEFLNVDGDRTSQFPKQL